MRYNKRKQKIHLYLLIILGLTVGFALVSTTLRINGTANIKGNTWNIYWDETSINVTSGSVTSTDPDVITTTSTDDTVSFNVNLKIPKDYYEFTIDAVNDGSVDAALDLSQNWIIYKSNGVETTKPNYLDFNVTYDNGTIPQTGDILKANRTKTYKIKITYKDDENYLPDNDESITIETIISYVPYKEEIPKPRTCQQFQSDSWSTIAHNVTLKPDTYPVGCEKDIDMGTYGTHTVRVANNTTPNECKNTNFSQTACGFVLEFKDVVTNHRMNPNEGGSNNGNGNYGGWEYSDMRNYISTTIYNSLPTELKNLIINTYTVSGHGSDDPNNFNTIDKLYLLNEKEVWGNNTGGTDSSSASSRQLDYYYNYEVTPGLNTNKVSKAYNNENTNWWLRSASTTNSFAFYAANNIGSWINYNLCNREEGVSPAFRIGKDWVLTNNTNPLKSQKWEYYYNNGLKLTNGWYKLKDFSGVDQYYFFENGFMKLGWYTDTNNNTYYLSEFDEDNNSYVDGKRLTNSTIEIDGVNYTFDSNGICTSGCQ